MNISSCTLSYIFWNHIRNYFSVYSKLLPMKKAVKIWFCTQVDFRFVGKAFFPMTTLVLVNDNTFNLKVVASSPDFVTGVVISVIDGWRNHWLVPAAMFDKKSKTTTPTHSKQQKSSQSEQWGHCKCWVLSACFPMIIYLLYSNKLLYISCCAVTEQEIKNFQMIKEEINQ